MATEPKPQTWADNAKDIVASVASWMLVECVATNTRWNSLTDGDGLVLHGMELAESMATHRGIPLGTLTLTPGELLTAMQAMAKSTNAPGHPLPVVEAPVVTSGAGTSATVHSGGTTSNTVFSGGTETSSGLTPVTSSTTVTSGGITETL